MDLRPIGIFDSGVGGLTAVRQLVRMAPAESFVYLGDTIRAPYGDRPPAEIQVLSRRNARFLRSRDVKALIVACNTSTANAFDLLSADNADIPIAGTIAPAAARAAGATKSGRIGVIATTTTIQSGLYEKTIRALRPDARVVSVSCPKLVPLIEGGHTAPDDGPLAQALAEYLAPMREAGIDTLVLACTHYPLISGAITAALGFCPAMIDSGAACVGTVLSELKKRGGLAPADARRAETFFCTGQKSRFAAVARDFLGRPIDTVTAQIDIDRF